VSRLTRSTPDYAPMDASDARTLSLAALLLDDALLNRYVHHQEVFLAGAEAALRESRSHAEALAQAHQLAARASGLTPREEGAVAAAVRLFCTTRHAIRLLDRKLERLNSQPGGAPESEVADARTERARLDAMVPLRQRYGAEGVACLMAREARLCSLHERTTHLLSRGG
jgi:hypothetical protein